MLSSLHVAAVEIICFPFNQRRYGFNLLYFDLRDESSHYESDQILSATFGI